MGLFDVLLGGKKKLKGATLDRLFALSTARVTLQAELGLKPSGSAAVVFKPLSAGEFVRAENEMQELLDVAARDSGSKVRRKTDDFGFEWLVVEDRDFEDLRHPVQLIYGYKRGAFWPFVPTGTEQERDNPEELRLKSELEKELPIEPDLTRWLAPFHAPLSEEPLGTPGREAAG